MYGSVIWRNREKRRNKPMKNSMRWSLILAGIIALLLITYYLGFRFWPLYPMWGWRYHYFGPKIFLAFPLLGLLIMFAIGFVIFKFIFLSSGTSSASRKGKWAFCPFCGGGLTGITGGKNESLWEI